MLLKNWTKSSVIFIISVIYYAMVQLVYTVSYMVTQKATIVGIMNVLRFVLLFAPIIIFTLRFGLKDSKKFFEFLGKYCIFYLLYIAILYFIRENIVLGPYSVDLSIIGLYFELNKNALSDFLTTYMYVLFDDNITVTLFSFFYQVIF